jgi:hypothetical protein
MDRLLVNEFESISNKDFLKQNLYSYISMGKIASAIIGENFISNSMTCLQSVVPDLNVNLSACELYELLDIDATAYGSLPVDTRKLVNQGINLNSTQIGLTAPATVGNSINYLIQANVDEIDTDNENRNFFNGTPPAYSNNINTRRADFVNFSAKAGTSAPTGTQATPTPDSGYCGCFVVTVAQGQTSIVNANISRYTSTNSVIFLDEKLQDKISLATADARYEPIGGGFPIGSSIFYDGINIPSGWLEEDGSAISRTTYSGLLAALTKGITCTTTNSSNAITVTTGDLSRLGVGMVVEGSGIPSGSTIATIVDSTNFTISANATASATGVSVLVFPHGAGNGTTTFNIPDWRSTVSVCSGQGSGLTNRVLGQKGGAESHSLSIAEMPAHNHPGSQVILPDSSSLGSGAAPIGGPQVGTQTYNLTIASQGSGSSFSLMNPFGVSTRIIKY